MADLILPNVPVVAELGKTRLPSNVNLFMWQGDVQEYIFTMESTPGVPYDLTDLTPSAVVRQNFTAAEEYAFDCTVIGPGQVKAFMPSSVTKTVPAGDYIWNLQLTDATGNVRTYMAGDVVVYGQVDKP